MGYSLKIGSLNARGLNNRLKRKRLLQRIRKDNYDIFMCQESHIENNEGPLWEAEWGGKMIYSAGSGQCRGVCTYISNRLNFLLLDVVTDDIGRYSIIKMQLGEKQVAVCNVYAPNKDDPDFFSKLFNDIDGCACDEIVLAGDFNLVLDEELDSKNRSGNNYKACTALKELIDKFQLCDLWRVQNLNTFGFSWVRRKTGCLARLDYVFVSYSLYPACTSMSYEYDPISDHYKYHVRIEQDYCRRGKGLWKLNCSLLDNAEVMNELTNMIRGAFRSCNMVDIFEVWERLKCEITAYMQKVGKSVAAEEHEQLNSLYCISNNLNEEIVTAIHENSPESVPCTTEAVLRDINSRIKEIEIAQAKRAAFRAKVRWVKEGERNTKYFFSLEKRNYNAKTITKLLCGNHSITQQADILAEMSRFYEELYSSNREVQFDIENTSGIGLTEYQKDLLDSEITELEVSEAIKSMSKNKAPGCDGLSIELYQALETEITPLLTNLFKECMCRGLLNDSARIGVISLIPKKDKDPTLLKNWRPLTLLNCDYKILAKLLALRMKSVLPDIIGYQQTGFMEGRHISDNIRKTIDIVAQVYRNRKSALVVNIDYEKCFDRIEHVAIFGALKYFNFGDYFSNAIRLFFTDFRFCSQNNRHTSGYAYKTCGVNQGCPVSPYIFLLCSEIMAHKIKENPLIKGLKFDGSEAVHTISQFADDTMLFLEFEEISLQESVRVLMYIEQNTGLKISYEKTTVFRVGSCKHTDAKFYTCKPLAWSDGDIDTLGVTVSNNGHQSNQGFNPIINKMKCVLSDWYTRSLTLMGKVLVINTLAASLFVYRMTVLPMLSAAQLKRIDTILTDFLWNGKRAKIPLRVLRCSKKCGGLQLADFKLRQKSLHISWLRKLEVQESFQYAHHLILPNMGSLKFKVNLSPKDYRNFFQMDNNFWTNVYEQWLDVQYMDMHEGDEVLNEIAILEWEADHAYFPTYMI